MDSFLLLVSVKLKFMCVLFYLYEIWKLSELVVEFEC
jgi:hypothetical protein